ncbi:hypothetical protein [Paraburkholderia saeva]|jgi:hypothetical protein|uniref:Uncharacterized protein n=1 Tax=Paraburkholderia saeva TaxID=2777537 RepID=A0A9N8X018_9BURK|nr:hypothetical protein [Paraburkholderia saeva]CAG4886042.1 hypothetical protein LMG31841_00113 [Paraburkholderia saeva]CAG4887501.1 hypothetical protein R70241_00447 [Paraburkholderia saeva]
MQRPLFSHELELLEFLLFVNEPVYGDVISQWIAGLDTSSVSEYFSPYSLTFDEGPKMPRMRFESFTLQRELIAIDEGVAVLVYALASKTPAGNMLDSFSVDRLDGEPLQSYPKAGSSLMIMERGRRIGGADLRAVYHASDAPLFPVGD